MALFDNVDIGTSAAIIAPANAFRKSIILQNNHASNDLYVGNDDSVDSSNGFHIAAGSVQRLEIRGPVWGIASAASTDVRYIEEADQG